MQEHPSRACLISIHSLVKRETTSCNFCQMNFLYFNPLPRKEGDYIFVHNAIYHRNFNPLPRKEGDFTPEADYIGQEVFQSTPS